MGEGRFRVESTHSERRSVCPLPAFNRPLPIINDGPLLAETGRSIPGSDGPLCQKETPSGQTVAGDFKELG